MGKTSAVTRRKSEQKEEESALSTATRLVSLSKLPFMRKSIPAGADFTLGGESKFKSMKLADNVPPRLLRMHLID
jgi:hypothetical protein